MAAVSGNIYLHKGKRGDSWYVRDRVDGREVRKRLGPAWNENGRPASGYYTRKTAQAELERIEARAGELTVPTGATFGDACAEWLRWIEHDKARAPSTVRDYRNAVSRYLLPTFGADTPLDRIDTEQVEALRAELLTKVSPRTTQKVLCLLHGIFKRAKRRKWTATNPVEDAERVSVQESTEFNVLTVEQVEAVARAAGNEQISAAIIVAAYTGLRTGELRALRWRHVDFATANLYVRVNLPTNGDGEDTVPKGKRARSVPLNDDAARALDGLSRREHYTHPDDYVFVSELGGPLPKDRLRDGLYAALAAAGIDRTDKGLFPAKGGFTFHDLRHTYVTFAAQVYRSLVDVQAYAGHAQIQTTMKYAHHVEKHDAAAQFSEFVAKQKGAETVSQTVSQTAEYSGTKAGA